MIHYYDKVNEDKLVELIEKSIIDSKLSNYEYPEMDVGMRISSPNFKMKVNDAMREMIRYKINNGEL